MNLSEFTLPPDERSLERLLFVCDATMSMGEAMKAIRPVLATVMQTSRLAGKVREVAVLFYCDYGNPQVVWSSGWGLTCAEIAAFVAKQQLWNGFDVPEAAKTALVEALRACADRPTTVVWYTDAPPHYVGCPGDYRGAAELAALVDAPTTDWVGLSRLAHDAGLAVYAFLLTSNDKHCSFYCALAEITGGAAFLMRERTSDAIARHTLGLLMLLAGFPHDFLRAVERILLPMHADLLISEADCESILPTGPMFRSPLSFPLGAVEPAGGAEDAERTLAERFWSSPEYRDVAYDVFANALLVPSSASALGSNKVLMAIWRNGICRDRADPRRQACCDKMSVVAQDDPVVAALIEASYDRVAEVLERIAAHTEQQHAHTEQRHAHTEQQHAQEQEQERERDQERALILDLPDAERWAVTHKDIQELGRSCSRTALQRMVALLTGLREVPVGTPGSIPASIDGLFGLLSHLLLPGAVLSRRASMILAALAVKTGCAPVLRAAERELEASLGEWIGDAAQPENYAPDFVAFVVTVPFALTSGELERFSRLHTCSRLLANKLAPLDVRVGFGARAPRILPDRKSVCTGPCGYERSFTELLPDGTCVLCAGGEGVLKPPPCGSSLCSDASEGPDTLSLYAACRTCETFYALATKPNVQTKCFPCRFPEHPSSRSTKRWRCTLCANLFMLPGGGVRSHPPTAPEGWTCPPCHANGGRALSEPVEGMNVMQYAAANGIAQFGVVLKDGVHSNAFFDAPSLFRAKDMVVADTVPDAVPDKTRGDTPVKPREGVLGGLPPTGKPPINADAVAAQVAALVAGDVADRGECSICCDAIRRRDLLSACGRNRCSALACRSCLDHWYGEPKTGQARVAVARLHCAFCKKRPAPQTMRRHNADALRLGKLELVEEDARWLHGWCVSCNRLRRAIERDCAGATGAAEADGGAVFRCDECVEAADPRGPGGPGGAVDSKAVECPGCGVMIEKAGGCNHICCTNCSVHFCILCGFKAPTSGPVYEHIYARGNECTLGLEDDGEFVGDEFASDDDDEW